MKVTFLKDHLHHKEGEVTEVSEERANYWILHGVAEKEKAEKKEGKEKKEGSPVQKKNNK